MAIFTISEEFFFSHRLPIAIGLHEKGYRVTLITKKNEEGSKLKKYPFLAVKSISFHPQKIRLFETIWGVLKLSLFLKKNDIEILHNYGIKPNLFGSIAARIARVEKVCNTFTGLGILFSGRAKSRMTRLYMFLLKNIVFSSQNINAIFQNVENQKLFLDAGIINASQSHIIRGSGVNPDVFIFKPEAKGAVTLTLASRIIKSKGIQEFLLAAEKVHSHHPNVRFNLIGRETPGGADALDFDTKEWKSKLYINWADHQDDIRSVIQASHIIVLPTYYGEGVPKFLIEGASSGRPCITTEWPGCNDIVKDKVNGLLVPPKNVDALFEAMMSLIENKSLRESMGLNGRRRVIKYFSESAVIEGTISLYNELF